MINRIQEKLATVANRLDQIADAQAAFQNRVIALIWNFGDGVNIFTKYVPMYKANPGNLKSGDMGTRITEFIKTISYRAQNLLNEMEEEKFSLPNGLKNALNKYVSLNHEKVLDEILYANMSEEEQNSWHKVFDAHELYGSFLAEDARHFQSLSSDSAYIKNRIEELEKKIKPALEESTSIRLMDSWCKDMIHVLTSLTPGKYFKAVSEIVKKSDSL